MTSLPWYHKTSIYQIYPRSFFDSNNDGIGDLQGLIQKLDYIQQLGFETIWVSPFFSSPQADTGYDISDYTDIAPEYGSMQDALQLIDEVHKRGMRIVFDMVMNHTSDQHPWFKESRSSRDNPKADWYIWRDKPKGLAAKPTNWHSVTGGSGWHYAPEREQYYWATFLPFQPDLNYRNPDVKQTMLNIVRFWLGKGVDGFRLDIFNYIYKDAEFRDNPFSTRLLPREDDWSSFFQQAKYTVNQPGSFAFAGEFRSVCNEFGERLSIGEVSGGTQVVRKFLGGRTNDGLTLVFDFGMLEYEFSAEYFRTLIENMERQYPHPFMPVYVFGNHDRHRSIERLHGDQQKAKLLHMLQMTVRGVPCMYYGEEIGMRDRKFPFAAAYDPIARKFKRLPRIITDTLGVLINRDEVRTPMQWDGTKNAGFSSAKKTWLPVHENHTAINVDAQDQADNSLLNTIRALLKIRTQEECILQGSLELLPDLPRNILGYCRTYNDQKRLILLNFSSQAEEFFIDHSGPIIKLHEKDEANDRRILLSGISGMILKAN